MEELWNAVMPFLKKSLSASQEALPQAPAPAEVAHPAPDQEERAALALRRELHTLIREQLCEESERGKGRKYTLVPRRQMRKASADG